MAGTARSLYGRLEKCGIQRGWPPGVTKTYTSKAAYVGYRHECAYTWQKGVRRCLRSHCPTCWAGIFRQSSSPDGKACYQPATTDESFTHPNAIVLDPFAGSGSTVWPPFSPDAGISVSSCLNSSPCRTATSGCRTAGHAAGG